MSHEINQLCAQMSRLSSRVWSTVAAIAIVILVVILVVLWTGIRTSSAVSYRQVNASRENDVVFHERNEIAVMPEGIKGDVEYVIPRKISRNQYEDPPTGNNNAKRHHSGHFRQTSARVWDPHPQYEFTAFGKPFRLRLAHDNSFISQDITVMHVRQNKTKWEHPGEQLGCYYSGVVDGDPKSIVSVSLCHGITGHMKTSTGTFIIKPTDIWKHNEDNSASESNLQHAIYRVSTASSPANRENVNFVNESGHNCGVVDYDPIEEAPEPVIDDSMSARVYVVGNHVRERRSLLNHEHLPEFERDNVHASSWRPRRALPREYFIEIMIVADVKMVEYHGSNLEGYILVLMSTVSRIFKDPSIGNPISISVTKIVPTDEIFGTKHNGTRGISAAEMLKRFCHWQKLRNPDEPSPKHHDAALLLTRENLCHDPVENRCDTLGLAELGRMCTPGSSCAIVHDNGLAAAFTIAHELGHVFDMPHDDEKKCAKFSSPSPPYYVMSKTLDDNTHPWEWSKCSRHHITEFLDGGYANCLLDEPKDMIRSDDGQLPGEGYTENEQCELVFGPDSKICLNMSQDVCKKLWCTTPSTWNQDIQQCHTQHMPWADGTPCAHGKWCHRGECVSRQNLAPIDGQWGEWGSYGECSRTCGGGIKKKFRECNNPSPLNGGNYCIGERVKYRSCGTKECSVGSMDFREEQCSMSNNNNYNLLDLPQNVKWHAKYIKIPPEDRCKLYCQVESNQYYMLRDKVIDGTPCGPDTFHICVNGLCKQAGCDHVLNSTAELDTCGVCRGNNSTCQRIAGTFNSTGVYGYRRITKIPAGSSYIDIRQHGWGGLHNDSNYLALRLAEEHGKYILNGNYMVMHRKIIARPGIAIEYSGPGPIVERLNSSRPIAVDLILEVLSVGDIVPPQITYEYTVPRKILGNYTWIKSRDWSSCSHMCQGTRQRRVECVSSSEHKDVVSDDYCRPDERPHEENQLCNTHCMLQWKITSESECSNHCGPGTKRIFSHCMQISNRQPDRQLPLHVCAHLERPQELVSCEGPCDDAHWSFSDWGPCSAKCGGGIQRRTATCIDSKGVKVAREKCRHESEREHLEEQQCGHEACPQWTFGEWSPCSKSCGIGVRSRLYWCQLENRIVSVNYCSALVPSSIKMRCNAGPCHRQWSTGEWSPCSVTCGKGNRKRKVACLNADGNNDYTACAASEKPPDTDTCVLDLCPTVVNIPPVVYDLAESSLAEQENEIDSNGIATGFVWKTKSFSECSQPCNGGIKTRTVECLSTETQRAVMDNYCDADSRPSSILSCNQHACPQWKTGAWSPCDVTCGAGMQYRQVVCVDASGETIGKEKCNIAEKPKHVKKCAKLAACNNLPKWKTRPWTRCSKSCGGGIKTRRVECVMPNTEQLVNDEMCLRLGRTRPTSQRPCQRMPCSRYTWQEGEWSECSADCDVGIQQRAVTCHRINRFGWIDPARVDSGCISSEKPSIKQACKLRNCNDQFYWSTGPWRKCSHACGRKGRQIRRLFCHDLSGRRVARFHCPVEYKPQRRRRCNQRRCGILTCVEARKKFKTVKDGEYMLLIGGRNMSIYCHAMDTSEPSEYLTLPAGDVENYAEIYDKRLKDPYQCPYNQQRNDSCDCVNDVGTISGKTSFKRVRIDVSKLTIVPNDYTFSWTRGANRVEYGKAGDCFSLKDCPQGRFSINLSGTMLKMSPQVTWESTARKSKASISTRRINDQIILGKCGGYCGFCTPKTDLKLDVLS